MIKATIHITRGLMRSEEFPRELSESIDKLQALGLKVEVQYRQSCGDAKSALFSALLIGRTRE